MPDRQAVSPKLGATPGAGDPDRRERHADRHQPRERQPVRDRAEQRLDDRGADRDHQQQRAGGAVGVAALGDQERDQRGNGALTQIRRGVATRECGQSAAVEIRSRLTSKQRSEAAA